MYTVFTTVTAALMNVEFEVIKQARPGTSYWVPPSLYRVGCGFLEATFALLLWRLGTLVRLYQEGAYTFADVRGFPGLRIEAPKSHRFWRWFTNVITVGPFVSVGAIWIFTAIFRAGKPIW
jgi:hypothetical protein